MTVTIKKNVDVQAELKADKFKFQVKRDLSGDVQWTNCTSVGNLATSRWNSGLFSTNTHTAATSATTNQGWNFFKVPKLRAKARVTSMATISETQKAYALFYVNGVKKASTTATATSGNYTATVTTTPVGITLTSTRPNTITVKVKGKWAVNGGFRVGGTVFASMLSNAQRNDKTTVMATT